MKTLTSHYTTPLPRQIPKMMTCVNIDDGVSGWLAALLFSQHPAALQMIAAVFHPDMFKSLRDTKCCFLPNMQQ